MTSMSKFNRSAQAMRQTGSSFKPFVIRLLSITAFVRTTRFSTPGSFGNYSPGNYDGKFRRLDQHPTLSAIRGMCPP